MNRLQPVVLLACAATFASTHGLATASATDDTPIETTVTVDAGQTLRTMDPQRLGGTNVALWYFPSTYDAPQVMEAMRDLHARYIRIPGGSWANGIYWNGHGVRDADGEVDSSRVGPDGYPAVDYSGYAPSFRVDVQALHPEDDGWHGHVDVKKQHDWIRSIPGSEAMACPNAGTGRAVDAAEWVRWANQTMGYDVRYWEIGNELGGSWEAGTEMPLGKGPLTGEIYARRYNEMADAMRAVDPTIKIGGGAFVEDMLRDCGDNVDFVMHHTYPGSTTMTDAQMFAAIDESVAREVGHLKELIQKYQPDRADEIEIAYTEWNVGGGVDNSKMFSGLWASIFLGEIAHEGVHIANQWDCFSDLFFGPDGDFARKSEYYALWLWNNYMGDRLLPASSSSETVYTYASRSDDAVTVMLINTDPERDATVSVRLAGFEPAGTGEVARVTSREYYYNPVTRRPLWSTGARIERLATGPTFDVTLPPFSMNYVRVPSRADPALSPMAQEALAKATPAPGTPELRFIMPDEVYAGDQVSVDLIAVSSGSDQPYSGTLAPAALTADGDATFDRSAVRFPESVGHFSTKPMAPGKLTLTARSGDIEASHTITVKPSVPRPVVFWDFSDPPLTSGEHFTSNFALVEELTQRANRAVARVDLPAGGVLPGDEARGLLKVERLPDGDALDRSNIRGVVCDVRTSADFACDDPDANILVVMQSPANWWMALGTIPLRDAGQWTTHQLDVTVEDHLKAMPSAMNILFILQADEPASGSIYFDRIGFMVR